MSRMRGRTDSTFSGVFLIGLAILFLTGWWWPGVMFVIGFAMIARALSEGREWTADRNALVVLGIGVLFLLWDVVDSLFRVDLGIVGPILLIGAGVYLLYGRELRGQVGGSRRKRDDSV